MAERMRPSRAPENTHDGLTTIHEEARKMADENHNDAGDAGNGLVTIATSVYECRILLEAVNAALETLVMRGDPPSLAELGILQKLLRQAMDAAEHAQGELLSSHGVSIGHA